VPPSWSRGRSAIDAEQAEALEVRRSAAALERATEVLREYVNRARRRLAGDPEGPVREALSALCEEVTRTS
jgi:heptaprenyl diphosphate synthase